MLSVKQTTRLITETSYALEAAERDMLDLAMYDPGNVGSMNEMRCLRAGLIARLDRLTRPQEYYPLRLAV